MQLTKLVTTNFKRLGTFTADFTSGLNVIGGDNFKGKSTLLRAIEAALFGVTTLPGKKEDIPTWGQKDFSLLLRFNLNDQEYEVSRNKSTAKLVRVEGGEHGDQLVANGSTPVTAAIEELLGLSAKDYSLFLQSRQHEVSSVLKYGATALNRKVEEFAGVDLIDKVQQAAQTKGNDLSSRAAGMRPTDEQMAEARQNLANDQEDLAAKKDEVDKVRAANDLYLNGSFQGVRPPVPSADLRQQRADADKLWLRVEAADAAVPTAVQLVKEAEERMVGRELQDVKALQDERAKVIEDGITLGQEISALDEQVQAVQLGCARLDPFIQRVRDMESSAPTDPGAAPYSPTELSKAGEKWNDLQEAKNNATRHLEAVRKLQEGAKCPTCGQDKVDHDQGKLAEELEQAENQLAEANNELEEYRPEYNKIREVAAAWDVSHLEYTNHINDLEAAVRERDELKTAVDALPRPNADELAAKRERLQELRDLAGALNTKLRNVSEVNEAYIRDLASLSNARQRLEAACKQCHDLNKAWEDLPEPPTDEEIQAALDAELAFSSAQEAWRTAHQNAMAQIRTAEAEAEKAEARVEFSAKAVSMLESGITRAKAADEEAAKYLRLVRFLRDRRQAYMTQVWDVITNVSSHLVNQASKGAITRIINKDGGFFYEESGVLVPAVEASGAQAGLIGCSLRIGLTRALYGSDALLIFDEPTESCSEHNASSLSAMLATSAKQVLLITHRETDQALANNIINVG